MRHSRNPTIPRPVTVGNCLLQVGDHLARGGARLSGRARLCIRRAGAHRPERLLQAQRLVGPRPARAQEEAPPRVLAREPLLCRFVARGQRLRRAQLHDDVPSEPYTITVHSHTPCTCTRPARGALLTRRAPCVAQVPLHLPQELARRLRRDAVPAQRGEAAVTPRRRDATAAARPRPDDRRAARACLAPPLVVQSQGAYYFGSTYLLTYLLTT